MRPIVSLFGVLCLSVTASADSVDDYARAQLGPRHLRGVSLAVIKDGRIVKNGGLTLGRVRRLSECRTSCRR